MFDNILSPKMLAPIFLTVILIALFLKLPEENKQMIYNGIKMIYNGIKWIVGLFKKKVSKR